MIFISISKIIYTMIFSTDTFFEVCDLTNLTKYHVRVASMNKGGNSNWLELDEPASTTASAVNLVAAVMTLGIGVAVIFSC